MIKKITVEFEDESVQIINVINVNMPVAEPVVVEATDVESTGGDSTVEAEAPVEAPVEEVPVTE